MSLQGGKLAGGNPKNGRVDNDFYATNPEAVCKLLNVYNMFPKTYTRVLEPCVGQGHIAEAILGHFDLTDYDAYDMTAIDIVDRGYPDTIVMDFLNWETIERFDAIVTNPPYSLAAEFVEKGMGLLDEDGRMAMFLKIQFLEGAKRKQLFDRYPPKYIYVFRNRMATWNNGNEHDENGKKWATTMCHAWFVWEKGFYGEPIVRWL